MKIFSSIPVISLCLIAAMSLADGANASGLKILYKFKGGDDGAGPEPDLIALGGKVYGTTFSGGGTCNCGTFYSITPDGVETAIFQSTGYNNAEPFGLFLMGNTIVGATTSPGGGTGSVFKYNTSTGFQLVGTVPYILWPYNRRPVAYIGNTAFGINVGTSTSNCDVNDCGYIYSFSLK